MDLDDSELYWTRKKKGLATEKETEEYIRSLEKKVDNLEKIEQEHQKEIEELETENKEIIDYSYKNDSLLDLYNKEKEKNKELIEGQVETLDKILKPELLKIYISKDKIKEKIEEYKKEADYRTIDNPKGRIHFHKEPCDYQIEVLQELLQEGDDK